MFQSIRGCYALFFQRHTRLSCPAFLSRGFPGISYTGYYYNVDIDAHVKYRNQDYTDSLQPFEPNLKPLAITQAPRLLK